MSVVGLFSFGLVPLSQALGGPTANAIGAVAMFIAAGILTATASGIGLLNHDLRTRRATEADAFAWHTQPWAPR